MTKHSATLGLFMRWLVGGSRVDGNKVALRSGRKASGWSARIKAAAKNGGVDQLQKTAEILPPSWQKTTAMAKALALKLSKNSGVQFRDWDRGPSAHNEREART
jgi:hypothetical protein